MRFLLGTALCAMVIGLWMAALLYVLQEAASLDALLGSLFVAVILSVFFTPVCIDLLSMDVGRNASQYADGWLEAVVCFGVLLAIASSQTSWPASATRIRGVGPLCRIILAIHKYACFLWLIFPPAGTLLGILCIMYLRRADPQAEKSSGDELQTDYDSDDKNLGVGD